MIFLCKKGIRSGGGPAAASRAGRRARRASPWPHRRAFAYRGTSVSFSVITTSSKSQRSSHGITCSPFGGSFSVVTKRTQRGCCQRRVAPERRPRPRERNDRRAELQHLLEGPHRRPGPDHHLASPPLQAKQGIFCTFPTAKRVGELSEIKVDL